MATHWVSNLGDGSDSNDGLSSSTPKANPYALTVAHNDTVNVKGGGADYDRPDVAYVWDVSTLATVTLQRWPGFAKPAFTHTGDGVGFGKCIRFGNGGDGMVTVDGFIVRNTVEAGMGGAGAAASRVTIKNCELYNIGLAQDSQLGTGIELGATTPIGSMYVYDTIVDGTGRINIYARCDDTYEVARCVLKRSGYAAPGVNTGDCIASPGYTPTLYWIHENILERADKGFKQFVQHSDDSDTSGTLAIIENNTMIGQYGVGESFKGIYLEMPYIVRGNRMSTGGFIMNALSGGEIYGNGFIVCGPGSGANQGAILIENELDTTCDIDNNTIILIGGGSGFYSAISAYFDDTKGTGRIRNNAIIGPWTTGIRRHSTAWTEDHNCIYGATLSPVRDENLNALSLGTGTTTINPKIDIYDFLPALDSPILRAGTPIADRTDLFRAPFHATEPAIGCRHRRMPVGTEVWAGW